MSSRLELHEILKSVIGNNNVYYQPPESIKMNYPAIVYSRENIPHRNADNLTYNTNHVYTVTVIDQNPDSDIVERVSKLPQTRFIRHFTNDRLNHDVFQIWFDKPQTLNNNIGGQ